jgi:putative ATP-dependent endonuclease of OLD family
MLKKIKIKNFCGIQDVQIDLDETTVLIGGNNTGKSTILNALRTCLSRSLTRKSGPFTEYDYHLQCTNSQPTDAEAIDITLIFSENTSEEWNDEILQLLADAIQLGEDDLQSIILNVTSRYDDGVGDFVTTWNFLDLNNNPLPKAGNPRYLYNLQQLTPVFYLSALRDAAEEFRPRSQFWGPFVRALKIETELREEIENNLCALNQQVLDAHEAFDSVRERLRNTSRLVPLGGDDPVAIEAIPTKVFDMLSRTQVMLSGKTGARLPIGRHGEGTQSLAVICLFDAFLEAQLAEGHSPYTQPILALEEPEAHLHPSAIRAVGNLLHGLRGQKVISTHSGELVASVPITALRRLRRSDDKITVHQVASGSLTGEEQRKLDHHVRFSRGNLLFASFWLLVEGETDSLVFQECARIMGHDLFCEGICCIEFSTIGVEKFIKLADQLGIDWLVVADKDQAGDSYVRTAQKLLQNRRQVEYICQHSYDVIETFLCMEGYGEVYEANISTQKRSAVTASQGTPEYWKQVVKAQGDKGKPQTAAQVIDEIEERGATCVPQFIREVIEIALLRAKEAV